MNKRIKHEFEKSSILSHYHYNEKTKEITFLYKNSIFVKLDIDNYPFRPPNNLHINGKKIHYYQMGITSSLKKYFDVTCLCCLSTICSYNWKCTCNFEMIMKEYELFKQIAHSSIVLNYFEKRNKLPNELLRIIASFLR